MRLGNDLAPRWMYVKAALFLLAGIVCAVGVLAESPAPLRSAFFLAVGVWSFCRLYYFMFYAVEKYADPAYKFAGLGSFIVYLWRRRRDKGDTAPPSH